MSDWRWPVTIEFCFPVKNNVCCPVTNAFPVLVVGSLREAVAVSLQMLLFCRLRVVIADR